MSGVCPLCGGATDAATLAQPLAQLVAQLRPQVQVAHVFDSKPVASSNPQSKSRNEGYEQGFLEFWVLYPLRRDKRKAQIAWRNAIKRAATSAINAGATRYADDPNRLPQYTKYPEGWLNGDGWEDDPLPSHANGSGPVRELRPYDHFDWDQVPRP